MEVRLKQIYEVISKRDSIPIDLIESVGNAVFDSLHFQMNHPDEIAYELPKVGTFNIRFNRFLSYYKVIQKKLAADNDERLKHQLEGDPKLIERLDKINTKIQEYREKKQEKRKQRYDQISKTSQNNLEEH